MFWSFVKFQAALAALGVLAAIVVGLLAPDEYADRRWLALTIAPFVLVNAWLVLKNWLIYIYEVGVRRDRVKATVALALLLPSLLTSALNSVGPLGRVDGRTTPLTGRELDMELALDREDIGVEDRQN